MTSASRIRRARWTGRHPGGTEHRALADVTGDERAPPRASRALADRRIRAGRRQSRVAVGARRRQHWCSRHGRQGGGTRWHVAVAAAGRRSVELRDDRGRNRCRIRHCVRRVLSREATNWARLRGRYGFDDRHDRQGRLRAGQHGHLHRGRCQFRKLGRIPDRSTWPTTPASTVLPMSMCRSGSPMAARAMPTASPMAPSSPNGKSPPMAAPPAPGCSSPLPPLMARPRSRRSATRPIRSYRKIRTQVRPRACGRSTAR